MKRSRFGSMHGNAALEKFRQCGASNLTRVMAAGGCLDIVRRVTERGLRRAQERGDSEFIDIFQHLMDELERVDIS